VKFHIFMKLVLLLLLLLLPLLWLWWLVLYAFVLPATGAAAISTVFAARESGAVAINIVADSGLRWLWLLELLWLWRLPHPQIRVLRRRLRWLLPLLLLLLFLLPLLLLLLLPQTQGYLVLLRLCRTGDSLAVGGAEQRTCATPFATVFALLIFVYPKGISKLIRRHRGGVLKNHL
jgi:hypothetical protein